MRTSSAFAASDELRQRAKISRRVMPKVLALLIEVVEPRQIRPGAGIIPTGHSSEASQFHLVDLRGSRRHQVSQRVGVVVAAGSVFVDVGFEDITGTIRIVLQVGQTFEQRCLQRWWMKRVGLMPAAGSPNRCRMADHPDTRSMLAARILMPRSRYCLAMESPLLSLPNMSVPATNRESIRDWRRCQIASRSVQWSGY